MNMFKSMSVASAIVLIVTCGTIGCLQDQVVNSPDCGTVGVEANIGSSRIIGGQPAAPGRWPWMVALHGLQGFTCGGSVINNQFILTAGHCVFERTISMVVAGEHNLNASDGSEQERNVVETIIHPNYTEGAAPHDIAILKLDKPLELNELVRPVCIAEEGVELEIGRNISITGWGRTEPPNSRFGNDPSILQEAVVPIVDMRLCEKSYNGLEGYEVICAGYDEGGVDTCFGDSGGPLVAEEDGRFVQHGITSFGSAGGCAEPGFYGVYTKVPHYIDWIEDVIRSHIE